MKDSKHIFLVLALILTLILAGCTSPGSQSTNTTNESDSDMKVGEEKKLDQNGDRGIEVRNGSLPVSPTKVFGRVQEILGTDVAPPGYVKVVDSPDKLGPEKEVSGENNSEKGGEDKSFRQILGIIDRDGFNSTDIELEDLENGVTTSFGGILLYPGNGTDASKIERLLAHEFVHYIHFKNRLQRNITDSLYRVNTNTEFISRSILEGSAVYATDRYVERYIPDADPDSELVERLHQELPDGTLSKYRNAPYYFGHRYVSNQVDSADELSKVYENPPLTTEQLIHGYSPSKEPRGELSLSIAGEDSKLGEWRYISKKTLGEAFIRFGLENGVSEQKAKKGASGWDVDQLRLFRKGGNRSYLWITKWDDQENATEFKDVFIDYLNKRGKKKKDVWSLGSKGETAVAIKKGVENEKTVVIAAGYRSFIKSVLKEEKIHGWVRCVISGILG